MPRLPAYLISFCLVDPRRNHLTFVKDNYRSGSNTNYKFFKYGTEGYFIISISQLLFVFSGYKSNIER